jgi:pimeloyl-ACP methyl ester carboxylesterase
MSDWVSGTLDRSELPDRTLMIWGAESALTPPPVRAAWRRAFPSAEVNEIAGTDHALITQAPSAVAQAIADFLAH